MAINPMALLQMKGRLETFQKDHPRVRAFFHQLRMEGPQVGTVLELKATLPDGRESVTNIRLTENDIETIQMLNKLRK